MNAYEHTQVGYVLLLAYGIVIVIAGVLTSVPAFHSFAVAGLILMVVVISLFATLKVTVTDHALTLRFGVGVIRKQFRIEEIAAVRVVKNPWYYGWGINYTPRGWLFNVSGWWAIELEMRNGRRYRIGTDVPEELAAELEAVLDQK